MMPFEDSLAVKLQSVFMHDRVYPDIVPLTPEGDGINSNGVPCVTYRLVNRRSTECVGGQCRTRIAQYLIEMFDRSPESSAEQRDVLQASFRGPVHSEQPGMWVRWIPNGPKVQWAECHDASADSEFPMTDAHDVLSYNRAILEIRYYEGS
jgi:hypothetical protein